MPINADGNMKMMKWYKKKCGLEPSERLRVDKENVFSPDK